MGFQHFLRESISRRKSCAFRGRGHFSADSYHDSEVRFQVDPAGQLPVLEPLIPRIGKFFVVQKWRFTGTRLKILGQVSASRLKFVKNNRAGRAGWRISRFRARAA